MSLFRIKNLKRIGSVVLTFAFALSFCISDFGHIPFAASAQDLSIVSTSTDNWDTWSDTWALEDELGRNAPDYETAGGVNGNKQVGIFYLPDVNSIKIAENVDPETPRNITEIISNNADWKYNANLYGPESAAHYWDEPLFGYYSLLYDDWVIRQHAIMLADAGVDFIIIDLTNYYAEGYYFSNFDWSAVVLKIMSVFRQIEQEGQKVPKITALYTWYPGYNGLAVNDTYTKFIRDNLDLWYYYEGKPLLFANDNVVDSSIKDLFTYRTVSPSYDSTGMWQWCAIYPQSTAANGSNTKEAMSVSTSQNWTDALSFHSAVDEYGRFTSRGRSWSSVSGSPMLDTPVGKEWGSEYGYNFQEQFNRAIEVDADLLFITEWNGWINARFKDYLYEGSGNGLPNRANFVDGYSSEFSRTIEPTLNEYLKDNFYCQLIENIRYYKGVRKSPDYTVIKTISDMSDWESVPTYYRDSLNDKVVRDKVEGAVKKITIDNMSGRNDFKECKVARDNDYLYFYAECMDDIKLGKDRFMELYIKTDGKNSANWEGYNYLINNSKLQNGKSTVEKFSGTDRKTLLSGYADVKISGNKMQVKVILSDLGLGGKVDFEFKWFDAETNETLGNALDFYCYGDAAPNYRFNYVYTEDYSEAAGATTVNLYNQFGEASGAVASPSDVIASKFTAVGSFRGVDLCAYSVFDRPSTCTVELYKFKDNYASTLAQKPLFKKDFVNVYDRTTLYIDGGILEKGDYLYVLKNMQTDGANISGVYFYDEQDYNSSYFNGNLLSKTSLKLRVEYTDSIVCSGKEITQIDAGDEIEFDLINAYVSGISIKPDFENLDSFPSAFTVYVSSDGENYTAVHRQNYNSYLPTPSAQNFMFKDSDFSSVKKVKVVFESGGTIDGINVLEFGNAQQKSAETKKGVDTWFFVVSIISIFVIGTAVVLFIVLRKDEASKGGAHEHRN